MFSSGANCRLLTGALKEVPVNVYCSICGLIVGNWWLLIQTAQIARLEIEIDLCRRCLSLFLVFMQNLVKFKPWVCIHTEAGNPPFWE